MNKRETQQEKLFNEMNRLIDLIIDGNKLYTVVFDPYIKKAIQLQQSQNIDSVSKEDRQAIALYETVGLYLLNIDPKNITVADYQMIKTVMNSEEGKAYFFPLMYVYNQ